MKEQISLIIPTVNAHEELDLTLSSIEKNSTLKIDLIVIVDPDQVSGKVSSDILRVCSKHKIKPLLNKNNLGPYGSWNRGAEIATSKWIVFATDDQYFAPRWDAHLLASWKPKRLVVGRLVEPGIIPVYRTNIKKDFGITPKEFDEGAFTAWCARQSAKGYVKDGFFIPMLISKTDFETLGHYPVEGKFGTSAAVSNDYAFMQRAISLGYQFGTASDSYSYHFQASSWKKKNINPKIAAVVLTKNEAKDLPNCLKSLKWVNDIYVIDSGSTDKTVEIARKYKAKVVKRKFDNFAATRNFALAKVIAYDWVLMIDADEVVEDSLSVELKSFAKDIYLDGVNIPRKNHIFGKWIRHADWYPDYRLVFVRPKLAKYEGDVHERIRFTKGNGNMATATSAIVHHNYDTVQEFVVKNMVEYPRAYAAVLDSQGIKFNPLDMLTKPLGEFMRRYFLTQGYKDGMYGLILSLLMGSQTLFAYVYLWEMQGKQEELSTAESKKLFSALRKTGSELSYWLATMAIDSSSGALRYLYKARRKALKVIRGI